MGNQISHNTSYPNGKSKFIKQSDAKINFEFINDSKKFQSFHKEKKQQQKTKLIFAGSLIANPEKENIEQSKLKKKIQVSLQQKFQSSKKNCKQNIEQNAQNSKKDEQFSQKKVFIFDWDDTLFFTSHLKHLRSTKSKMEIENFILQKFDETISSIIKACIKLGKVYIVTNSQDGWVNYSSKIFLPKTNSIIFQSNSVTVISSRPKTNSIVQFKVKQCKFGSFKHIIQNIVIQRQQDCIQKKTLHLICIGDSNQQINASKNIHLQFNHHFQNFYLKTIKLKDCPDLIDIIDQQQLLLIQLESIANIRKRMIIRLERPKSKKVQD